MDKPTVVRLPDGTHWLVHGGRGSQIRGDRFLFWAKALYGFEERDAADWQPGEGDASLLFGGPGGIEQVATGQAADPLGFFGAQSSEANFPYKDGRFIKVGNVHYLVLADGKGYVASGAGQVASLTELYGPPDTVSQAPPVFGSVTGAGPNDLFRPNEIEVFSGLPTAAGGRVDTTTGDDALSIVLPELRVDGPVSPDRADPNAPSVSEQIAGATGDRTPGLTGPATTAPPVPADPTQPVGTPAPAPAPSQPTPGPTGPYQRPSDPVSGPSHYERPQTTTAAPGPYQRPAATQQPYQRPDAPVTPFRRPSSVATYSGTPAQAATLRAMRPLRDLGPPQFPALRAFQRRTGGDVSMIDRLEGRT